MTGRTLRAHNDCAFGSAMAVPSGLEPETVCLEGRCSIQLSYGTWCGRLRAAKFGTDLTTANPIGSISQPGCVQKGASLSQRALSNGSDECVVSLLFEHRNLRSRRGVRFRHDRDSGILGRRGAIAVGDS